MHEQTIQAIVSEIEAALAGRSLRQILPLAAFSYAFDFHIREGVFLFISVEPAQPRLYLIRRKLRELEKQSNTPASFVQALRSNLSGARLLAITQDEAERIVRFRFVRSSIETQDPERVLVAQLTGRSSNLHLLKASGEILQSARELKGAGQQTGAQYVPPTASAGRKTDALEMVKGRLASFSAAADDYYQKRDAEAAFAAQAGVARSRIGSKLGRLRKLQEHLRKDLEHHGDAKQHKQLGELLLASVNTAERSGNTVRLRNLYAEDTPIIELEIDANMSLPNAAQKFFVRYAKARRAASEINARLGELDQKLKLLEQERSQLEEIISRQDANDLSSFMDRLWPTRTVLTKSGKKPPEKVPGTRRYISADGYEMLVGRTAKDNDHLTFRVARPHDLWLHAADYPGSHVIVRCTNRKELPQRTVIQAAELAAKFSQANNNAKVDVHYTPRKYVSKIKGAAPGLVRLASFRTITVEPKESGERS